MGRRISSLSSPDESLAKKKAIEQILIEARLSADMDTASWLPRRRYLQKVLWSLSLGELKQWTVLDSQAVLAELDGKDHKTRQIAQLEQLAREGGIALTGLTRDKTYQEIVEQNIARARDGRS